jgi:hypothetical protein
MVAGFEAQWAHSLSPQLELETHARNIQHLESASSLKFIGKIPLLFFLLPESHSAQKKKSIQTNLKQATLSFQLLCGQNLTKTQMRCWCIGFV